MRHRRILKKIRQINPYRGVWGVFLRELRRFRADGPLKIVLFGLAPLFACFFCALYGNGGVFDVPVAILDNDHSSLSRMVIRSIDATKLMRVVAYVSSIEELKTGIISGQFAAGFVFPEGMQADVKSSRKAHPQLYCNGTSYLTASLITREALTIARTVNAGAVKTRLTKSGIPEAQAIALVSPIAVDISNLYNPTINYSEFLCPGLIFAQLGTMVLLAGAICFAREREHCTLGQLRFRAASSTFSALHGKALPYALCITVLCAAILFILFPLFHISGVGDGLRAIPGIILFFTASWWMGATIGTLVGKVLLAASLSFGIGMPSFLFSGWTFPLPAAPTLYSWIATALPFPHLMPIWFNSVQKGFGVASSLRELTVLLIMTIIAHFGTRMLLMIFWDKPPQPRARHA
jgi:ABC-2 type transport system permease protein